jgi:hypothetical protein
MQFYCPDCGDTVPVEVEDNSFDHEFGTEWIFDYHCHKCKRLLHTRRERPTRVVEPDYN